MTDEQKELILNRYNICCENYWNAVAREDMERATNWSYKIRGMDSVLQVLGFEVVWDLEYKYIVDVVKK